MVPNKKFPNMSTEEMEQDSMKKCKAAAFSKRREAALPLLDSSHTQLYACAYCSFETMTHADIVKVCYIENLHVPINEKLHCPCWIALTRSFMHAPIVPSKG